MRHSFMYALLIGITSTLSLENGTVPKFVEKTVFLLAHLSVSQLCLPLSTQWVLSAPALLVCMLLKVIHIIIVPYLDGISITRAEQIYK